MASLFSKVSVKTNFPRIFRCTSFRKVSLYSSRLSGLRVSKNETKQKFLSNINFVQRKNSYTLLPPPQAPNTLSIFCATTTTESDNQVYFKHFEPARLVSERCTIFHKVVHPSVFLPSCTGMSLKIIKT